jgi:hypothetical protein
MISHGARPTGRPATSNHSITLGSGQVEATRASRRAAGPVECVRFPGPHWHCARHSPSHSGRTWQSVNRQSSRRGPRRGTLLLMLGSFRHTWHTHGKMLGTILGHGTPIPIDLTSFRPPPIPTCRHPWRNRWIFSFRGRNRDPPCQGVQAAACLQMIISGLLLVLPLWDDCTQLTGGCTACCSCFRNIMALPRWCLVGRQSRLQS